jgi:formylglycine-generating enzyme required for sulfatase activity
MTKIPTFTPEKCENKMPKPLKTFIIYAREDAGFKNELLRQLAPFAQMGLLEKWDDSHILPGEEWEKSIEKALDETQIVLMLVSADSLFSDFIQRKELKKALEQKREGSTRIIPILVSDCMYDMAEGISDLQMLPLHPANRALVAVDNLAIWGSRASAWATALRQLREVIADVNARIEIEEKELALEAEAQRAQAAEAEAKIQREKEAQARAERQRTKDEAAWKAACELDTLEAYEDYLDKNYTLHADEAHARIAQIEEAAAKRRAEQRTQDKAEAEKKAEAAEQKRQREVAEQKKKAEEASKADPFHDSMVLVKGGTFDMGDTFGDGDSSELPVHEVSVPDFYMGKYPVTQAQWKAVMEASPDPSKGGENPSRFKGDDLPVENVSWDDAQAFLQKLNEKTGKKYRLPSEAEWEYAAREGGKKVRFGNGKDIADPKEMNFDASKEYKQPYSVVGEYRKKTTPVGQFPPNALGLHDLSGNVWEWCEDVWHDHYKGAPTDGSAWVKGGDASKRVIRGGAWYNNPTLSRVANRYRYYPFYRNNNVGFRVVRGY